MAEKTRRLEMRTASSQKAGVDLKKVRQGLEKCFTKKWTEFTSGKSVTLQVEEPSFETKKVAKRGH